jgi:hypothetical protein
MVEKPAKSVLVCTRPFFQCNFHGHGLETPGASCDRPLSLTRRTMATTQEVKLFGKWTFDDVEVRRYARTLGVARAAREGRGRARARDRRALGSRNPARACAECIGMFTSRATTWSSEHATDNKRLYLFHRSTTSLWRCVARTVHFSFAHSMGENPFAAMARDLRRTFPSSCLTVDFVFRRLRITSR